MGRLLSDMSRKMQARVTSLGSLNFKTCYQDPLLTTLPGSKNKTKMSDQANLKILVHSTHDTTIAGLCSTLDVFDET